MIRRQETLSTVRTRVREHATMCTFVAPMPSVGFKAFIAEFALDARAGTNTPSDEYDTYRDTGWRIRYVSRIHFFSEAKLGNG